MIDYLGGAEWQTVLLFSALGLFFFCGWLIWQRKTEKPWEKFHVVGLFADIVDGNWQISQTKFQSFGAFVISSIGVVVCVIRGQVPGEFVALLTIYGGLYVLGRLGQQQVSSRADVEIKKEEIRRGRRFDVPDDEYAEATDGDGNPLRRRESDRLFK